MSSRCIFPHSRSRVFSRSLQHATSWRALNRHAFIHRILLVKMSVQCSPHVYRIEICYPTWDCVCGFEPSSGQVFMPSVFNIKFRFVIEEKLVFVSFKWSGLGFILMLEHFYYTSGDFEVEVILNKSICLMCNCKVKHIIEYDLRYYLFKILIKFNMYKWCR